MALKKSLVETKPGFEGQLVAQDAYWRVNNVYGNKTNVTANVVALVETTNQILTVKEYEFSPNLEGDNFIKQAYNHLKTLPEFSGAVDC